MRRAGFLAVLAFAASAVVSPVHSLPLIGSFEISMTWSPGTPPRGVTVTFTTSASDNDGAVRVAQLCFGDGTPCQTDHQSLSTLQTAGACLFGDYWDRTWTHKYTAPGNYFPTLTVTTRGCPGMQDETRSYTAKVTVT